MGIIALFLLSFGFPALYNATWYLVLLLVGFFVIDIIILFSSKNGIEAERILPEKFSNGDQNPVIVSINNYYTFPVFAKIIDEIPEQFQERNFNINKKNIINHIFLYKDRL